jgi:hypothetical protein
MHKCSVLVHEFWEAEELEVLPFVVSHSREVHSWGIMVHLNVDEKALKQFNDLMKGVNDASKDSV